MWKITVTERTYQGHSKEICIIK